MSNIELKKFEEAVTGDLIENLHQLKEVSTPEFIEVASYSYAMVILDPVILGRKTYTKKYNFTRQLTQMGILEISFSKLVGSHDTGALKSDIREHKISKLGI